MRISDWISDVCSSDLIDRNTPDVPGGVIERDAKGEPTGIVKDAAKDLVIRAIGAPTSAQIDATVERGIDVALSKGVTQVHPTELETISFDATRRPRAKGEIRQNGSAHGCTPVTNAHL